MLWILEKKKGVYKVSFDETIGVILINHGFWDQKQREFLREELSKLEKAEDVLDQQLSTLKKAIRPALKKALKHLGLNDAINPPAWIFHKHLRSEIIIFEFAKKQFPQEYEQLCSTDWPDITNDIREYVQKRPGLLMNLYTFASINPTEKGTLLLLLSSLFESLYLEYERKSVEIFLSSPLQRTLQPLNLSKTKERNIARLTLEQSYKELVEKNPKALEELRKFLSEEHEILLPPISTVHEQMLIDIIAQLLKSEPQTRLIRIYIKPKHFNDFHDGILVVGKDKLIEKFKLTDEEFKKIFIGRKREPSAVERLNNKPFAIRNTHGELTPSSLITATRFKSSQLHFVEIKPHPVFINFSKGFVKDNLWKLRKIKEEVNPKAQKPLLNLRNKLITLDKTLTASFRTLAEWAGLFSRKERKWSKLKGQITKLLEYLRQLHDIDYRIEGENVRIWKPE